MQPQACRTGSDAKVGRQAAGTGQGSQGEEGRPRIATWGDTVASLPACALDPKASHRTSPTPGLSWHGVEMLGALGEAPACPPPGLPVVGAAEVSSRIGPANVLRGTSPTPGLTWLGGGNVGGLGVVRRPILHLACRWWIAGWKTPEYRLTPPFFGRILKGGRAGGIDCVVKCGLAGPSRNKRGEWCFEEPPELVKGKGDR